MAALKLAEPAASPAAARDANILAMAQAARSAWGSANAQPVAPAEARQALVEAHAARANAEPALKAASNASMSARGFLQELEAELAKLEQVNTGISRTRASELAAALKAGEKPQFSAAPELPHAAAQKAETENRIAAAREALSSLAAEEAEADRVLNEAKVRVAEAVKAVVAAEADAIACEVERLEAQAAGLREQLGTLVRWRHGRTARLSRVMAASDWYTNGPEDRRSQAYGFRWSAFSTALESNAEATLDFANLVV
jgi:hypothetical protein